MRFIRFDFDDIFAWGFAWGGLSLGRVALMLPRLGYIFYISLAGNSWSPDLKTFDSYSQLKCYLNNPLIDTNTDVEWYIDKGLYQFPINKTGSKVINRISTIRDVFECPRQYPVKVFGRDSPRSWFKL